MSGGRREFLWVAVAGLVLLCILALATSRLTYSHPDFVKPWDHHDYVSIAEQGPLAYQIPPYCWRILNPLIARFLPFDLQTNFFLISFICLWGTAVLVYYLCQSLGFSRVPAWMGLFFFLTLGWGAKFLLFDFWLPDPLAFLFITAALIYLVKGKEVWFAALLAVGVTAKESVIFMAPICYSWKADRFFDLNLVKKTLILALPAIVVLLVLRLAIQPGEDSKLRSSSRISETIATPGTSTWDYWGKAFVNLKKRLGDLSWGGVYHGSIGTFGLAIVILVMLSLRRNPAMLLKFLPFLILVYSQVLFVRNTERVLVAGFPVIILMALNGAEALSRKFGVRTEVFLLYPLALYAANLLTPDRFMPPLWLEAAVIGILILSVSLSKLWNRMQFQGTNP